jgi:putative transport protein
MQPLFLILRSSPLLTLFLVSGIGYALGQVSFFGFRLGVAGALFAGLLLGAWHPELGIPEVLGTFGLVLFVYSMGLQSGPGFFRSLRRHGAKYSAVTAASLLTGFATLLAVAHALHLSRESAAGLFTGATTNTPALGVVLQLAHSNLPAETYSIAYPFGVVGILLCLHLARMIVKPELDAAPPSQPIRVRNFTIENPDVGRKTIEEVQSLRPDLAFRISRVRHQEKTFVSSGAVRLEPGDQVVVVGNDESLRELETLLGRSQETHLEIDRTEIDFRRIIVSNRALVGKTIAEIAREIPVPCTITRLRRADEDFVPTLQTRLYFGDRIRVVARQDHMQIVSRFFGDSIRGTAEMNFASVGVGLVAGVLVGMIPVPVAGFGTFRLGFGGGPLLVALVLGALERSGPFLWTIPTSANLTLRHLGLLLFLVVIGGHAARPPARLQNSPHPL